MRLIAGNSNRPLADAIALSLGVPLVDAVITKFADTEIFVEMQQNVRGKDTFLIQSVSRPANDNLMEMLIMMDALRRGSARRITVVVPYFGYARQDRKTGSRTPISAKLVANLMTTAGADRVLTVDLHSAQIQGFFDIPLDNLQANYLFLQDIKERFAGKPITVVSPDIGGVGRARVIAKELNVDLAIIDKRREKPGISAVMNVIGDVRDTHCILIDDIADSCGTLCNAAVALKERGATTITAYVSHGIFSGDALKRIDSSPIDHFICTDSIAQPHPMGAKVHRISIAQHVAESIRRIHHEESMASLFL